MDLKWRFLKKFFFSKNDFENGDNEIFEKFIFNFWRWCCDLKNIFSSNIDDSANFEQNEWHFEKNFWSSSHDARPNKFFEKRAFFF